MKKFLSRIFSVVLVAATVASPSMAQLAKKAVSPNKAKAETAVTAKAQKAPAKANKGTVFNQYQIRTKADKSSSAFSSAQSAARSLKSNVVKAPAKEAGDLPTLNGMIIYNTAIGEGDADPGLYQIPLNSTDEATALVTSEDFSAYGGVCIDGTYYATGYTTFLGFILSMDLFEVDIEGEEITHYDLPSLVGVCTSLAVDPTTGTVYGIGYNADGSGLNFQTVNFSGASTSVNVIAAVDRNWNTIAFDKNGQLWGISYTGESDSSGNYNVTGSTLCKIDKATGAVTEVGATGCAPKYVSSGCIDPASGRFFWNVCPADETGNIYEVNLSTGEASFLYELALSDEIMGMYVPQPAAEAGAPAACEDVELAFSGSYLDGYVNLTAPSTLFDGTPASGNVTIHVLVAGADVTKTAAYGEEVSVHIDNIMEAGLYTFTVYASNEVGPGPKYKIKNKWIGSDTPEATTATLEYDETTTTMTVSWDAVTTSVNGGYIDLDNITYTVRDANGVIKASGLKGTTWSEVIDPPTTITKYQYEVIVVCGDAPDSAPALTNAITLGDVVPPYTSDYAENGLEGWTILNENDDNYTWSVYNGNLRISWNSSLAMDDWAITMPIKLEAGKAYNFSFDTWSSTLYEEAIEVKYGTEPTVAGMTKTLLEPTSVKVTQDNAIHVENMIIAETTGSYYVGFHGISAADAFYLYVSNFTIGEGVSTASPGLGKIVAEGDPNGGLSATVNVTFPTTTMGGADLESITKAEILRGGEVVKTFDNPAVGGTDSYTDVVSASGEYEYSLVCYNEIGKGLVAKTSTYVGFDVPDQIESVTVARTSTPGEALVTWTPVTTDINGKPYPAGSVKYKVCEYDNGWVPFTEYLEGTSYTYQAVAAGEQEFVQVAVFPFYDEQNGLGAASELVPVGTPYNGIDETFADGTLNYIWGLSSAPTEYGLGGGTVSLFTGESLEGMNGVNDDNGFIGIKGSTLEASAMFFSGMVSLDQMVNPGLTFYTLNIHNDNNDPDLNEINVYVKDLSEANANWVRVYNKPVNEICGAADVTEVGEEGWNKVTVNLAEYEGKTVQVGIEGVTKFYVYTFVDNIKVGSLLAHDLKAAGIEAPAKVKVGDPYEVSVKVSNEGAQAVDSYSVELYADDELVATEVATDLAASAVGTVTFQCTMSPVAQEPVKYYAKVVYEADENPSDNTTQTIEVAPVLSKLPAPTDLAGESVKDGVKLTWNEPNLEGGVMEPVTDDFEDADAFAAEYGDWTFVDLDESPVGGFQGTDVPGITPGTTTGSFWIWDADQLGNQTFAAHSGSKYLFALFRDDDGTTNDWAISPELSGDAQTVSFYARSYSSSYPEKIRVCYTTSASTNPEDYTEEVMVPTVVPSDWNLYEVELPAGAMHFAINSCATGSFMLMVDDVTYTPAGVGANLSLKGYNVYRDGVKINTELVEETEFLDTNVEDGKQYTYIVTAVYEDRGESALSNEAVVTFKTVGIADVAEGKVVVKVENTNLVVLNAADKKVTISAANGAVVFSGAGEARMVVPVGKGVYVVAVDKTVKKVIVK